MGVTAARELMAYSSVDLTAKDYTHLAREDRQSAIDKLPDLPAPISTEAA